MQKTIIKTYQGDQKSAIAKFRSDAIEMAKKGYHPSSQVWAPGSYGCGAFIIALLLCFILIGILIFIYMLIVKPAGTLTVTYQYQPQSIEKSSLDSTIVDEKTCPQCAEKVKAQAKICRFCHYSFIEKQQ
ncbi:MAG: zinc ribbon domain-containing protein [Advenella sp.]|nr:zinc ribbon domain-containing protein [Advenella sp.]